MNNINELKERIEEAFPESKKRIYREFPMAEYSSFKAGGTVDLAFLVSSEKEIVFAVQNALKTGTKHTFLGNASNILVSDKGLRGIAIIIGKHFSAIERYNEKGIKAQAGALLSSVSKFAEKNGLKGMEFASGIPGTVGGAIFMNAGAYDGCMKDITVKTRGYNPLEDKMFFVEGIDGHNFSYRRSFYSENKSIVLNVFFTLEKGEKNEIAEKTALFSRRRRESQPLDLPSAGSMFKRPQGHYAGKLIEQAGLKGFRIGGACVCEKHAGFIVNDKNASAKDIYDLVLYVKKRVLEKHGVELETEVKFLGEW